MTERSLRHQHSTRSSLGSVGRNMLMGRLPFLEGCKESFVERLGDKLEPLHLFPAELLFKTGDEADSIVIIRRGSAEAILEDGRTQEYPEGSVIGDPKALLSANQRWPFTVTALTACEFHILRRGDVQVVFADYPGEAAKISVKLARAESPAPRKTHKTRVQWQPEDEALSPKSLGTPKSHISPRGADSTGSTLSPHKPELPQLRKTLRQGIQLSRDIKTKANVKSGEGASGNASGKTTPKSTPSTSPRQKTHKKTMMQDPRRLSTSSQVGARRAEDNTISTIRSFVYCMQEDDEASRRELAAWLDSIPFFSKMDAFVVERLLPLFEKRRFKIDELILAEGMPTDAMHIIHDGEAKVTLNGNDIAPLYPKAIFGERSIAAVSCDEARAGASIQAVTPVVVTIALPRKTLQPLLNEDPEMRRQFEEQFTREKFKRGEGGFANIRIFQDCDSQFVKALEMNIEQRFVAEGTYFFCQGDASNEAYLLWDGDVQVFENQQEIQRITVNDYADAAIFGEFCLLGIIEFRRTSVLALKDCRVHVIRPESLRKTLDQYPAESIVFRDLVEFHGFEQYRSLASWPKDWMNQMEGAFGHGSSQSEHQEMRQARRELKFRVKYDFALSMIEDLRGCSSGFLQRLENNLSNRLYMPTQLIMCEGEEMTELHFLQYGVCSTYFHGEKILASVKAPSMVGNLMSLMTKAVMTTVKAEETCFVATISKRAFAGLMDDFSEDRSILFSRAHESFKEQSDDFLDTIGKGLDFTLASLPILSEASFHFISELAKVVRPMIMLPGQVAKEEGEGDEEPKLYILFEGYCHLMDGNTVIGTLGSGDLFGEMDVWALTDDDNKRPDSKRTVKTVRTVELCKVGIVEKDTLFDLLQRFEPERVQMEKLVHMRLEQTVYARIAHHPCFDGLSSQFISKICLHSSRRLFYAEQDIVHEGTMGDSLFIFNRGKAELSFKGIVIGMVWPGKTFGAAQLLGISKTYHATLRTKMTCHILELTRKSLTGIAHGHAERQWMLAWQQRAKAAFDGEIKIFKRKLREQRRMVRVGFNLSGENDKIFLAGVLAAWRGVVTANQENRGSGEAVMAKSKSSRPTTRVVVAPLFSRPLDIEAKDYMQTAAPIQFSRGLQRVDLEVSGTGVTSTAAWRHWGQSGRLDVWKGANAPAWLAAVREEIPKQLMSLKAEARGDASLLPGLIKLK